MRFHLGSFFFGWLAGVATASLAGRLRPVMVELAEAGFRVGESLSSRAQIAREDVEDLLAEARSRARRPRTRTGRKGGNGKEQAAHA